MLLDNSFESSHRLVWPYNKSDHWWTEIVSKMNDRKFKENFRLERSTFLFLVNHIVPLLKKDDTKFRLTISVEKRICCALYCLGSSSELRTIGNLFGIGKSTVGKILHEFCGIIIEVFFYRIIKFPATDEEIKNTVNGFLDKYNYLMCLGALDGTHISIKPPLGLESDYYNYKKFHSIVMLAVVDSNLHLTYVNVGAPGRCNNASVYARSTLSEVIQNTIYRNHYIMVNNANVQAHLIADSAFALDRTLMKPYPLRPDMPREYAAFNYRLSRCRCSVERAFGLLKNRFRILHKKMEFDLDNTINVIKATVVLHNLCIISEDLSEIEWDVSETIYKKPGCNATTTEGIDLRHALTQYFIQNSL
ncbi:unnamed protein product [Rotaria sp. Silwood2]|nr:unnamed protein product [Rotaria sp. Silwood2]CAF4282770.1 unnamed protein product [Rotaria sp. Silwood2]